MERRDSVPLAAPCRLAEAALYRRWYGDPLEPDVDAAITPLAASGEPFAGIARYLTDLAHRDHWPSMPTGVPRQTLTLLASARRPASEFAPDDRHLPLQSRAHVGR
jgi:hypothetical protein